MRRSFALMGVLLASSVAASACEVKISRNWASVRGGFATVVLAPNAPPCGATLPAPRLGTVLAVRLAGGPAHGRVTVSAAAFAYEPNPGFIGEDRFTLVASGQSRGGRHLRMRGVVTVIVQ